MKKWALPLALAGAMALSPAALAAEVAATNFRGEFKTQMQYFDEGTLVKKAPHGDYDQPFQGFAGVAHVDLRGNIVLDPGANTQLISELRFRVNSDKELDEFPTRIFGSTGRGAGRFGEGSSFQYDDLTDNGIDKLYVQNKSQWWEGGSVVTTRVGRQDPNYNPWIGKMGLGQRVGVTAEGIEIGPLALRTGYIWMGPDKVSNTAATIYDAKDLQALILDGKLNIDNAGIGLTLVRGSFDGARDRMNKSLGARNWFDYAASLNVPVAEGVNLGAIYARDGFNEKSAYDVKLGTQLGMVDVGLQYRSVDEGFRPVFEDRETLPRPEERSESKTHDERTGFKVTLGTEVANWKLEGSYDHSYRSWLGYSKDETINTLTARASTRFNNIDVAFGVEMVDSKEEGDKHVKEREKGNWHDYLEEREESENTYTVELGTNFNIVRAEYKLEIEDNKDTDKTTTEHTLRGYVPIPVAYLDTLHAGAEVVFGDDTDTKYGIDLAWIGPNGIHVGLHYTDKWGHEVNDDAREYTSPGGGFKTYLPDGFSVTAGYSVSF